MRPHGHGRPRGRDFTARTLFLPRPRVKPRPRVNADAGGRPDHVQGRPDGHFHPKMSIMTSLVLML
jgi:hypothetical protein